MNAVELYTVETRAEDEHRVRWQDGVEAIVYGSREAANCIAQAREASARLQAAANRMADAANDFEFCAERVREAVRRALGSEP